ncbi:MAG: PPOX class F420-dependent oxidoreductase [Actinomycetota bacterium]
MVQPLTTEDLEFFQGLNWAHFAVNGADGYPHVTVVWVHADDTHILVNTAAGRVKDRAVQRDPRVSVSVHDQADAYRFIAVRGDVASRETGPEADTNVDFMSRKYHDEPWTFRPGETRVLYRIRPERIIRYP